MNTFLRVPAERRRLAFQQVDAEMGLQAFSVEKEPPPRRPSPEKMQNSATQPRSNNTLPPEYVEIH